MFLYVPDYTKSGSAKGPCIVLFSDPVNKYTNNLSIIYAVVRHLSTGGNVSIGKTTISLSGTYGNNGKPISLDRVKYREGKNYTVSSWLPSRLHKYLIKVPQDLAEIVWSEIEGTTQLGTSGPLMRDWAKKNIDILGSRYYGPEY